MLIVNERLRIPLREIHFQFARSSGPGGQNVNKVSSKAVLRWNMAASPSAPEDVKERLRARHPRRVTREGDVVITSSRFRDQGRNVADCLEKLRAALAEVSTPAKPRRPTRPTRSSAEKRLRDKRERAEKKRRGRVERGRALPKWQPSSEVRLVVFPSRLVVVGLGDTLQDATHIREFVDKFLSPVTIACR